MTPHYKIALGGSLALLIASAQALVYTGYVVPRQEAARGLAGLNTFLRNESKKAPVKETENLGASIPDVLSLVQELAVQSGTTVQGIEPVQNGTGEQFKLNMVANYASLLKFFARFERLQVAVTGFEVAPEMDHPDMLTVAIDFSHTGKPGPAPADFIKTFEAELKAAPLRDPFDAAGGSLAIADNAGNDLTWTLRLTSISEIGKLRFATIDGHDYRLGDVLQGRIVSNIGNDSVTLTETQGGEDRELVLHFRNAPPAGKPT